MFLTTNLPVGFLFRFLKDHLSLFSELFRNTYTKFSVQLIFLYSVFISFGVLFLINLIKKLLTVKENILLGLVSVISMFILCYYMYPLFIGNLISGDVRVSIPPEYFELFNWLNAQPDERRIANLPIHSFWGWEYYSWGYQGAGFLWFGTKQPVLARDFDRWNPYNEEYYTEMSHAIYAKDLAAVEGIVRKYGIGYVLLDENVITLEYNSSSTYTDEIKDLLSTSELLVLSKSFGNIHVYKVLDGRTNSFYTLKPASPYILDYPFQRGRKLLSQQGSQIYKESGTYVIKSSAQLVPGTYTLTVPDFSALESRIPITLYGKKVDKKLYVKVVYEIPQLYLDTAPIDIFQLPEHTFVFDEGSSMAGFLAVDAMQFFNLSNVGTSYQKLGSVLVTTDVSSLFALYSQDSLLGMDLLADMYSLNDCSTGADVAIHYGVDYVSLLSGEDLSCLEAPLVLSAGNYLFKTALHYKSDLKTKPFYCITMTDGCLSNLSPSLPVTTDSYSVVMDYVSGTTTSPLLSLFSPVDFQLGASKVSYKKAYVTAYALLAETFLTRDAIRADLTAFTNNYYTFELAAATDLVLQAKIDASNRYYLYTGQALCDMTEHVELREGTKQKICTSGLDLVTRGTTLFDSFNIPNIPNDVSYVTDVTVSRVSGYPLTATVYDSFIGKDIVNVKLQQATNIFPVPASATRAEDLNYKVGFFSQSIDNTESNNIVESVRLVPFSGDWLSNITLLRNRPNASEASPHNLTDVSKKSPFLYVVSNTSIGDTLVFETSYEKGWHAFGATNHHKVNGWANGWVITGPRVYVLFIPALLQVFGYFVAVWWFLWVFINWYRR